MTHLKLLLVPFLGCAIGCAGGPFSASSYSDSMTAGAAGISLPSGTAGANTGGSAGAEASTTGGEQTGGVEPTGGRETGGTETGGVEAGGALPTGGTPGAGGSDPAGITCGDVICEEGIACCIPWSTSTYEPFCIDGLDWDNFCGPNGNTVLGTVAECTSPQDCDDHCCVTFVISGATTRPVSSACGSCTDGKDGTAYACETDEDCANGRHCKQRTDLPWLTFKTCGS